jgi:hypothetical protein
LKTNHPATLVCSPTLLTGSIRRQPLKKSDWILKRAKVCSRRRCYCVERFFWSGVGTKSQKNFSWQKKDLSEWVLLKVEKKNFPENVCSECFVKKKKWKTFTREKSSLCQFAPWFIWNQGDLIGRFFAYRVKTIVHFGQFLN